MKKASILLGVMLVVCAVFLVVRQDVEAPLPESPAGPGTSHSSVRDDRAAVSGDPLSSLQPQDFENSGRAAQPMLRDPVDTGPVATVFGRCVDEHGEPLRGVQIKMQLEIGGDLMTLAETELQHGKQEWALPAPLETGSDGVFSFLIEPPRARHTLITARCHGRVSKHVWQKQLQAGDRVDLGDIVMPKGCQLRGRLVDLAGKKVQNTSVRLRRVETDATPERPGSWRASAKTDETGSFSIWSPLVPAEYEIQASGPTKPSRIVLHGAEQFVSLELQRPGHAQTISGQLRDQMGRPLQRTIEAKAGNKSWRCRSNAEGHFVLRRRADEPQEPVSIWAAVEYGMTTCGTDIVWDSHGLQLELNTGVTVPIRVLDGATDAPFEGRLGVRLVPADGGPGDGYTKSRRLRQVGEHPDGLVSVPSVLPGHYRLTVETATSSYAKTPFVRVLVGEESPQVTTVRLWRPIRLSCAVQFADGAGSPESRIELLQVVGPNPTTEHFPDVNTRAHAVFSDEPDRTSAIVLAEAVTNKAGHALLQAPRGGPFAVRVTGNHRSYVRYDLLALQDAELTFPVEATASVAISIQPWPLPLEDGAKLCLGRPRCRFIDGQTPASNEDHEFGQDGRARIDSLPAGSAIVDLALYAAETRRNHFATVSSAELELRTGTVTNVVFSVAHLLPVVQHVRVLTNGHPAAGARLYIDYASPRQGATLFISEQLDAAGSVSLGVARNPSGASLWVTGSKRRIPIPGFSLATRNQTFHLRTANVTLQVLRSDGATPLAGATIVHEPRHMEWLGTTDERGLLQLGEIGFGALRLGVLPRGPHADPGAAGTFAMRYARECAVDAAGAQMVELIAPPESGY